MTRKNYILGGGIVAAIIIGLLVTNLFNWGLY